MVMVLSGKLVVLMPGFHKLVNGELYLNTTIYVRMDFRAYNSP